ncbi:MAG: hypothetical protein WC260_02625 [Candidatus Pacearchaeota archaeon]
MILEILGKPPEYIKTALDEHVQKLEKLKDVKIIEKKINEPKKIKDDKQDFYTCFCEVEFKCQDLKQLADITFNFMPASIEIIDPERVSLNCEEASSLFTDFVLKLHKYDEIAKLSQTRIFQLTNQLNSALKILNDNNLIKEGKLVDKKDKK